MLLKMNKYVESNFISDYRTTLNHTEYDSIASPPYGLSSFNISELHICVLHKTKIKVIEFMLSAACVSTVELHLRVLFDEIMHI